MSRARLTAATLVLGLGLLASGCVAPEPSLHAELGEAEAATAAALVQHALEADLDGAMRQWSGDGTDRAGAVRPMRTFIAADGRICRDYEEMLSAGGRSASFRNTACRDGSGRWMTL